MQIESEVRELAPLVKSLKEACDLGEKQEILISQSRVKKVLTQGILEPFLTNEDDLLAKIALFSLAAIGQEKSVLLYPGHTPSLADVRELISHLIAIDHFYEKIGGIVGYHFTVLDKIVQKKKKQKKENIFFKRAPGVDLTSHSKEVFSAVAEGIKTIRELGEMYPLGGLGSRLGLQNKAGKSLPVALLPFCGRSLLEGLILDVQAREYLHYKLFKRQVTVPIAMMGSKEKGNMEQIHALCESKKWFGRPRESFFLFSQLSVPVLTLEGKWSMLAPFKLNLQPGGHGALWRTADENGVFRWFEEQKKKRIIIRQINNPIAGIDKGILALVGIGKMENRTLGFASCERLPHAAEGVLVMAENEGKSSISNIEYTDFQNYGIDDHPTEGGYSPFPANTNILYADLRKILPAIKKKPLPGLVINMKGTVPFFSPEGEKKETHGGRLESMMQNLSDQLRAKKEEKHPTFLTYNSRHRTISTAKRKYVEGDSLLETPEGAFYDLLFNGYELLKNECEVILSPFSTQEEYIEKGPSQIFLYHPSLGPLYEIIAQKIRRGSFKKGSELQLEITDIYCENLELEGSLLVKAENVMGHLSQGLIRYSNQTGKCFLKNIVIKNRGISQNDLSSYWKNQMKREESVQIFLEGNGEFFAENVILEGERSFHVPNGERWSLCANGKLQREKIEKPSFYWEYQIYDDRVAATLRM